MIRRTTSLRYCRIFQRTSSASCSSCRRTQALPGPWLSRPVFLETVVQRDGVVEGRVLNVLEQPRREAPTTAYITAHKPHHRYSFSVFTTYSASGVPRILEWEGSRCRRLRGGEAWGGYFPPNWGIGEGSRGMCPLPRKFFVFFVEHTIF